ncbi:MAG: glycoside hydrolase family 9 protein [Planctomycetota bacterium]|nr:glycoside hydrolase family 9 protein [Planctomycetota bacterium]
MKERIVVLALAVLACGALAADLPPPVTAKSPIRLWVDQIGYRCAGRKLVIVAGDQPLPQAPAIDLRDAKDGKVVWGLKDKPEALKPYNKGAKDNESGDCIAHLDLSDFKTPGRYYLTVDNGGKLERSCQFNVADGVYRDTGLASWKAMYYQRADCEKPEKYAGVWNHGENHVGPNQAKEARIYKWNGNAHWDPVGTVVADETKYDVRGGWWDAGDFNKYMGNTVVCHNGLLLAWQLFGDAAKDGELNIPESGNKIPDILDEIRYGTEFLIRMADKDGAAFGKCHELGTSPPEADKTPVQLTQTSSASTMTRCAALAYAALVWKESKLDDAFAKTCQDEALKAWKLLETKPHPWYGGGEEPKMKGKNTFRDWFHVDYGQMRATAAACLFSLTGNADYDKIVKEAAAKWKQFPPGDDHELYPAMWVYAHTKGADAETVDKIRKLFTGAADTAVKWSGENRGYAAGVRGYWWGSNRLVGTTAVTCLLAAELTADADAKRKYLDAAEEYIHYLFGRNPIGMNFFSNMKQFGAEHSVMVMFHSWVGKDNDKFSAKYIGEGEGKLGPFPGLVVGGVNGGMKRYEYGLHWTKNPWEFNEPDITYQSPCITLLGYFALKAK